MCSDAIKQGGTSFACDLPGKPIAMGFPMHLRTPGPSARLMDASGQSAPLFFSVRNDSVPILHHVPNNRLQGGKVALGGSTGLSKLSHFGGVLVEAFLCSLGDHLLEGFLLLLDAADEALDVLEQARGRDVDFRVGENRLKLGNDVLLQDVIMGGISACGREWCPGGT